MCATPRDCILHQRGEMCPRRGDSGMVINLHQDPRDKAVKDDKQSEMVSNNEQREEEMRIMEDRGMALRL